MTTGTIATITYRLNEAQAANAQKILDAAVERYGYERLVVHTGPGECPLQAERVISTDEWNIGYGNAMNAAVKAASGDVFVYVSAKRARMNDPRWVEFCTIYLQDRNCGMAGTVSECEYNRIARWPHDIWDPQIHVQGGAFAARTDVLRRTPWSPYFPQVFSDVWHSWSLIRSGYYLKNVPEVSCVAGGRGRGTAALVVDYPSDAALDALFADSRSGVSDISEHMTVLRDLAARANHVTEFGVRAGTSTVALLCGRPRTLRAYDVDPGVQLSWLDSLELSWTDFELRHGDSREVDIDPTDLLFIDTDHRYDVLLAELRHNHRKVSRRIACHDTAAFPDCLKAVRDFCSENHEWRILQHYPNQNGLTVLERQAGVGEGM